MNAVDALTKGKNDYYDCPQIKNSQICNALYDAFRYANMVLEVYRDMEKVEEFRRILFG